MAPHGSPSRSASPNNDGRFPAARPFHRPASIVSSRLTDLATDTGMETSTAQLAANRPLSTDAGSRPVSSRTWTSSKAIWPADANRRSYGSGATPHRGSIASSATSLGRTWSLKSRSHVPSLTSNAFLRPMSSQKLQAQRAGTSRSAAATPQLPPPPQSPALPAEPSHPSRPAIDDGATDSAASIVFNPAFAPFTMSHMPRVASVDMTEPDRSSLSEYIGPSRASRLQSRHSDLSRQPPQDRPAPAGFLGLRLEDRTSRDAGSFVSSIKPSPSFRSSLLYPGPNGPPNHEQAEDRAQKLLPALPQPSGHGGDRLEPEGPSPPPSPPPSYGRVHQYFDGNTIFCLGGRWQNAKHRPINLATGVFIIIPCLLFYVFEAPWLWHNISPAIPIIFAYLTYICFSSFVHASVSDPGILPRYLHRFPPVDENEDPLRVGPPTNDWTLVLSADARTAAMEVPVKHCRTCKIWRPPRAHHCRLCDNCVETHDHHCVWLNNCVGKRNYRYFFAFISSATLLSALLIGTSLAQLLVYMNREGVTFGRAMDHFRVPFALFILGILTFCYPAALMGYHIFLMARGETTREFLNSHKFAKKERYQAFDQGSVWRNFVTVLCRPRPPTYYRFKSTFRHGDQRLGRHRKTRRRRSSHGLEMGLVAPASAPGFQGPARLRGSGRGA